MISDRLTRRSFLSRGACATVAMAASPIAAPPFTGIDMPAPVAANPLEHQLDAYIATYMIAMNAPGMTLALTDTGRTLRTAGYGFADADRKIAVSTDQLFQIGSITKSFVALVLLQLYEEGKLDLQKPVLEYLPWLPITTRFGPISPHHLLTHTSGLPDNMSLFPSDPMSRHAQGFRPGEHFHYCNLGFAILGHLVVKLDGRPWRSCVQARLLSPLQMNETTGVITTASRARSAVGYEPFWDDQVYPRQGRLAQAGNLVTDETAGCIASTPGDMAKYLRMLLNRGMGPRGRIVSEESFALLSTPYVKASEFSPTAYYGYGIALDTLHGHKILRHTGGMISFASSIHVDLDGGTAAFASINAMQGYRPTAITEYAVRLMRAQLESRPLPAPEAIQDPCETSNAAEYAGTYTSKDGRKLIFQAQGKHLSLLHAEQTIPLEQAGIDTFLSTINGQFAEYNLIFGREQGDARPAGGIGKAVTPTASPNSHFPKNGPGKNLSRVVEVSYGPEWYTSEAYSGPTEFATPAAYGAFVGHYRSDSPWGSDLRVYLSKGQLMLSGTNLTSIGAAVFRVGNEAWIPDIAEFLHIVEGKAELVKVTGADFWRIDVG